MIWLYRFTFPLAFLLYLPFYLWHMWKRGGYAPMIPHRLGLLGLIPVKSVDHSRIWIQCVSVGELLAAEPLIEALLQEPDLEVVLTTTTSTGFALARKKYGQRIGAVRGFPIDCWPIMKAAFRRIKPDLCILLESDLWPEHLKQAEMHACPVIISNGRLSDRTFSRLNRMAFARPLFFHSVRHVVASSLQDFERFESLDLTAGMEYGGNLKCDVSLEPFLSESERLSLLDETGLLGFDHKPPLILLGASTWPGEERLLAQCFRAAGDAGVHVKLLLVPRHAERRTEIARTLEAQNLKYHLRSEGPPSEPVDVYVADTTGELRRFLQCADVVFVGKTMPPHTEGQTPIEAAGYGRCILFGPSMSNFRDVAEGLLRNKAAIRVSTANELQEQLLDVLEDPGRRRSLGRNAVEWLSQNRGATERTLRVIRHYLNPLR